MRRMSAEELDRQMRRAYPDNRMPGLGLDRNALGETGRERVHFMSLDEVNRLHRADGVCRVCGEPIVGRPATASTCLIHREYPGPPSREEVVALIEEHEAVVASLRKGLAAMDADAGQTDGEVSS